MFRPNRCPYRPCTQHTKPDPRFFVRFGSYRAKCRSHPVARFRCRSCRRTFSRQTFRADYRDHKPHLNPRLFSMVASGVGIRQCGRTLGLSLRCTELKLRKIGRHLRRLNLNLQRQIAGPSLFHFDELETYETERTTRPLTVPVLLESRTRFVIWAESAPIPPSGRMSEKRVRAIARSEKRFGIRRSQSRRSVGRVLRRGGNLARIASKVVLETDEKSSYPGIARATFGQERLVHNKTNSKLARTVWNPLFPVNHEEALMRDLMGRLRRKSWLTSKKRRYLDLALQVHIGYRNLVRRRFNRDEESPSQLMGFLPRRLRPKDVLSWRQDWKKESIHPLSRTGTSIRCWRNAVAAAS